MNTKRDKFLNQSGVKVIIEEFYYTHTYTHTHQGFRNDLEMNFNIQYSN